MWKRILVVLLLVAGGIGWLLWYYAPLSLPAMKREGKVIVQALDQYHAQYGHYPTTLEGLPGASSWRREWRYRPRPHGRTFELLIGDYVNDGFVLGYSSVDKEWWTDT